MICCICDFVLGSVIVSGSWWYVDRLLYLYGVVFLLWYSR